MTIKLDDLPIYEPNRLGKPDPGAPALTVREARLIGDLLGQHDAGIEMLSIRLSTPDNGQTVRATFRTPLGTFDFADCQVALDKTMAALIDLKGMAGDGRAGTIEGRRRASAAELARGLAAKEPPRINADSFERPKRKIYFED